MNSYLELIKKTEKNNMQPTIKIIEEKKLIGMSKPMSLTDNKTFQLFSTFMPRKKEISNAINSDVFDLRVYPKGYFLNFNPSTFFTKWVLAEVPNFENVPSGMETFTLAGGKYAVFTHKGLSTDNSTFQYIFTEWLPNSDFVLADRPHFEILGAKTKLNDPNSEEEVWVPVKRKA
jgi:AraC family transcriptional regulator